MNQFLTQEQNSQLEYIIESLYPESILSIEDIAYKLEATEDDVESVLIKLSEYQIIDPLFILRCDNEEFDHVHTFSFNSFMDLSNFVNKNNAICPDCNSNFFDSNVEVYFKIPKVKLKKVKDNG